MLGKTTKRSPASLSSISEACICNMLSLNLVNPLLTIFIADHLPNLNVTEWKGGNQERKKEREHFVRM